MKNLNTSIRRGFTLLEVIVACVILAMLAGVATYSLRGRIQRTQLIQANGTIATIDRGCAGCGEEVWVGSNFGVRREGEPDCCPGWASKTKGRTASENGTARGCSSRTTNNATFGRCDYLTTRPIIKLWR